MRIENVSDSEASMIAGEADRIRVPYDFDGWTEECPPVNTALDKIAVHHEWSNDRNQLYVCS